jgi:hypothetical protein
MLFQDDRNVPFVNEAHEHFEQLDVYLLSQRRVSPSEGFSADLFH